MDVRGRYAGRQVVDLRGGQHGEVVHGMAEQGKVSIDRIAE